MNLHARLRALERTAGPRVEVCGACGHPIGPDPPGAGAPSLVEFVFTRADGTGGPAGPEVCSACGRPLVPTFEFDSLG